MFIFAKYMLFLLCIRSFAYYNILILVVTVKASKLYLPNLFKPKLLT